MSKNPKALFLKRFEDKHTIKRIYGQSFYELNSSAILYFRFSKAHKNQFFFGVESDDLLKHKENNLFILFICEFDDQIIVIPIEDFLDMVEGTKPISNQWKVLISKQDNVYMLRISGKGKYDITKNLNQLDFRPKEFRTATLPTIGEFTPIGKKRDKKEQREEIQNTQQLEDRLAMSSSDSKHPIIFEKIVSEAFEKLGFKVKHIGGPGNTDVLVESPIRGIIDCKSTAGDSLTHINFARLKRHKRENDASFLLVISVNFDRAVVKDAEMEECTLMPVEVLREVLFLSRNYTLSPFEIEHLFKKAGLITLADIECLKAKEKDYRKYINSILRVIKILDFRPRDLKEIKGRLDYESEQKEQIEIKEEELKEILNLLLSPILSIVEKSNGTFSLRYSYLQTVEKLKNVIKELLSPNN